MGKFAENLKKKFESMTQEEINQKWEKLKHYNEIGPSVKEYIKDLKKYGLYPKDLDNESNIS